MKTIIINEKATIEATGTHGVKSHKPVICIDTGDVYASVTDAAEAIGTTISNMSGHLCGKSKSVKGKHFCYLAKVNESLNAITTRLRETSEMEAKAKMWDAMMAEQEAARKAEEKRQAAIAKAEEKVRRLREARDSMYVKYTTAVGECAKAAEELEALKGEEKMEEIA